MYLLLSSAYSQHSNSLYFLNGVPQNYFINPAFQNDNKFFCGFPGLAPFNIRLENTSFALKDFLIYDASIDSLITFLHPHADTEAFLSLLKNKNTLNAEVSTSLLSIGYKYGTKNFSFDISQRAYTRFIYPDDLLKLPVYGPDSSMFFDFNNLALHASAWTEIGMRISYEFNDRLQIGWRPKFLFGQTSLSTNMFNVTLGTGEEVWTLHSQIKMDLSAPFLNVVYNDQGMIDFDNLDFKTFNKAGDISSALFNGKNFGFSMDFGLDFELSDYIRISGSILDLGNIRWKKGVYNLKNNGYHEFRGVNMELDSENIIQNLSDSLKQVFKFSAAEDHFTTFLPTKIYAGLIVDTHYRTSFGILSYTNIFQGDLKQQFTLAANFSPIPIINTTLSYSIINSSFNNLGLGFSINTAHFNFYLISDTGPSALFWPLSSRNFNMQLGMNMLIAAKKRRF